MVWIATTREPGGTFGQTGKFYAIKPTATPESGVAPEDIRDIAFPSGVNVVLDKPAFACFNGDGYSRLYLTGGHTDNLVFTEDYKLLRQGILPPNNDIVNAAGSGSAVGVQAVAGPGFTGNVVSYIRWYDRVHNRRSPLSGPSPIVAYANQQATYDNLPTTPDPPDPSVTDIEIWEARDGNSPRLAVRRDVGTTTVTHATPTLSLGEAETDDFRRFPRCRYTVTYHDRQVMAGDDRYPDRVYFSVLNELERYAGFFLRTRRGEHVVGLVVIRDVLIVLCARSCYIVQGYTEDDIQMNILEPHIGCTGHHGVALCHNFAIIPSHQGFYLCTGNSMHFISQDFQNTWRTQFRANRLGYERSWAVNDLERNVYKLMIGDSDTLFLNQGTGYWVLDYGSVIQDSGGSFAPPNLSLDIRSRTDTAAAMMALPGGRRAWCMTGSRDGRVRVENVATNADDDDDVHAKTLRIRTGHYFFEEAGGAENDGATWPTFWSYMVGSHDLNLYTGDEYAHQHIAPDFHASFPSGALSNTPPGGSLEVMALQTVHYCEPNKSGRGITVEVVRSAPFSDRTIWSGFGLTRLPGPNNRMPISPEETPG